jgi:SAM-dependent methyltransferase
MAKLNLEYFDASIEGSYSDGGIEEELLTLVKDPEYDWFSDGRWPVFYHLSHLRHNILNWYPFDSNCSILEIGAGCGALTGLFCNRASIVKAVELTKRRAQINFERHKNNPNLEIIVGDFFKIPNKQKFDYIVINGVLEYAAYMMDSFNPFVDFLRAAAMHLKENGKILLAIENRLGLKYFSGAKEDHTGEYFSGLNGYAKGEKVRTFSKQELTDIILDAQMFPIKFYYPYPDYKFPFEIFTDITINNKFPTTISYPFDMTRVELFSERKVYESFMRQGIMGVFANSFLVEIAHTSNVSPADISYVKINANRHKNFRIFTYINSSNTKVVKKALGPEANSHIERMVEFSGIQYGRIKNLPLEIRFKDGLVYKCLQENSLENAMLNEASRGNNGSCVSIITDFRDALYGTHQAKEITFSNNFAKIFGECKSPQPLRWVKDANVDLVSGNIFVNGNDYWVIDYEWHLPVEVPLEFVLWRMLRQFIDSHKINWIDKQLFNDLLGIGHETVEVFNKWENHFIQSYVGTLDLSQLSKHSISINLSSVEKRKLQEQVLYSTLFFDMGNGFSGEKYERRPAYFKDGLFIVEFYDHMLGASKKLRWDPLEGQACKVKIHSIETDGELLEVTPSNAEGSTEDGEDIFYTFDPQYVLEGYFINSTSIKISFSCTIMDWTYGYRKREEQVALLRYQLEDKETILNNVRMELTQKLEQILELEKEINSFQGKIFKLEKEVNESQDKILILEKEIDRLQDKLNKTEKEMEEATKQLKIKDALIEDIRSELKHAQETLKHINNHMRLNRLRSAYEIIVYGGLSRRDTSE